MKKNKKIKSVKYNFLMNFILTATQFIFPLITFPYVSRILGAEALGKVSFTTSVANYFMMVASLGIPTYGIRACARVRDDKDELSKTVKEIFSINVFVTCLVMLTYVICILLIPQFYTEKSLFLINGLNIFLNAFGMNWVFQALEQYDYITFRSLFFKLIAIVLMFLFVHSSKDYIIYGAITVFAAVGSYVLNFYRVHEFVNLKIRTKYNYKRHIKPILILFAQSLAVSIYTNLDTVMLGFIKSNVDVGYYNAAIKIKTILLSLVSSLGNVLLPRMSFFAKNKMKIEFRNMMIKSLNFTCLMSISLSIYFVFFGKEAMLFLAGKEYLQAVLTMQIITLAIIPNGLTGILGVQVLTSIEKEKYVLYSVIIGALVDFCLNIVFIPRYGSAGAASATLIAEFSVLVVQLIFTRDLMKHIKGKVKYLRYIIISLIAVVLSSLIKLIGLSQQFFILFISAIIYVVVLAIGLLLVKDKLTMEIINVILKFLKRKR